MSKGTFDFSSATQVTPEKPAVSPLPNKQFGPKVEWPSATYAPDAQLKDSREGTGNNWFGQKNKGQEDFSSATSAPLPDGNSTDRRRPTAMPKAWER
ncbi:MAG TPA: hypothetical protein VMV34_00420 [Terriglobia bacterium]|nr:hypothetical protein [Terriglobia bacterium]